MPFVTFSLTPTLVFLLCFSLLCFYVSGYSPLVMLRFHAEGLLFFRTQAQFSLWAFIFAAPTTRVAIGVLIRLRGLLPPIILLRGRSPPIGRRVAGLNAPALIV